MILMVDKEITISKGRISKIERAGEEVIEHLIELARTTDLSHGGMAERINKIYGFDINRQNIEAFFKSNKKITQKYLQNRETLAILRVKLTLDYREQLVSDIRDLNKGIEELKNSEFLEIDKKWKQIGDLIDKKGRLLLRESRISGKMAPLLPPSQTHIDKMQVVNIINDKKSEIIRKLKNFEPRKIIDIEKEGVS